MADPVATVEQICRELLLSKYLEHVDSSKGDVGKSLFTDEAHLYEARQTEAKVRESA